jgi:hypothetical protein
MTDHTENTSHVIPTPRVYCRADCCLATSYKIRPMVACAYRGVFNEPLPGNNLTCHIIKDFPAWSSQLLRTSGAAPSRHVTSRRASGEDTLRKAESG